MADDVTLRLGADAQAAIDTLEKVQKSLGGIVAQVQKSTPIYDQFGNVAAGATAKVESSTEKATKSTSLFDAAWVKMTGAFTAAGLIDKAIGSLVSLGTEAVGAASRILDMKDVTGLSVEALQRLEYVEAKTNTQTGTLANAAYQLGLRLAGGEDSVAGAAQKLGFSVDQLLAMSPEQRFLAVAERLGGMSDETERNNVAVALFGKQWKDIAPAVSGGLREIGSAANVASEGQLRAISEAQGAWTGYLKWLEQSTTETLGTLVLLWNEASEGARLTNADNLKRQQDADAQAMIDTAKRLQKEVDAVLRPKPGALALPSGYTEQLEDARRKMAELTDTQRANIAAGIELGKSTKDIAEQTKVAAVVVDLYKDKLADQKTASDEAARKEEERRAAMKNLHSSLSDLTDTEYKQIAALLAAGKSESDIAKAYKFTSQQVHDVNAVETMLQKDRVDRAKALAQATKEIWEHMAEVADKKAEEIGAAFIKMQAERRDGEARVAEASMDAYELEVFRTQRAAEERKRAFKGSAEQVVAYYALVDAETAQSLEDIAWKYRDTQEHMLAKGVEGTVKARTAWSDALGAAAAGFQQLAQISDGAMSQIARSIGTGIAAADQFQKGIAQIGKEGHTTADFVAGSMSAISAVFSIGKIIESFFPPDWEAVTADIGRRWGISISDGLAQEIDRSADALLKDRGQRWSKKGAARDDAEILALDKVLAEAGLNAENMTVWIERALPLFAMVRAGGDDGAAATKTLVSLIDQFGKQATATGGLWSKAFKDMLAQARELGVGLETIQAQVSGQLDIVQSSTTSVVTGFTAALAQPGKALDDLYAKWKDYSAQNDASGIAKTNEQISALSAATLDQYQGDFDRLNRITLAAYNAYIANGHSAVEAIQALGPAIDQLIDAADKFGFAGGAAFTQLARWRELTSANAPLLDQVGSLNQLMTALENINGLTADSFADLQAQGQTAYDRLLAAGFTEQEALAQMKPLLETIRRLHEDKNYAVDEGTQKLLDQAEASGVLGAREASVQQTLQEGLGALIKTLGGDLPEAWQKSAQAAKDAADDIHQQATGKIQGGLGQVERQLSDRRSWQDWARNAADAAREVSDEVDHLNFGHSPGGLKEMPILLGRSNVAARAWTTNLLDQLRYAQAAVDSFAAPSLGDPLGVGVSGDGAGGPGVGAPPGYAGPRELHVHMPGPDGLDRVEVIDLVATAAAHGYIQIPKRAVTSEVALG